jgi:hypothetical protein
LSKEEIQIAKKHMVIKKIRTQNMLRFHSAPVIMATIQNTKQQMLRMHRKKEPSYWWECKIVQLLWKTVWRFLKILKIELPHYPEIPLLGILPKEYEKFATKHLHTHVYCSIIHSS